MQQSRHSKLEQPQPAAGQEKWRHRSSHAVDAIEDAAVAREQLAAVLQPGILLSQKVNCTVINAGDGRREHPTQALLDALTIINRKGKIEGLKIAICGDILHSRVARSNIYLMTMLGAEVNVIAPKTLMPSSVEKLGVKSFTDMKKGLDGCDIVMMLRLQNERMQGTFLPSKREYYEFFGLTPEKLKYASKDALIMHPGPMNRGVEIDTKLADDINVSLVKEQVELGVAVRMACLKLYCK